MSEVIPHYAIGGVVYRSTVHVSHMQSFVELLSVIGDRCDGIHYVHGSNLPADRASWLRQRIQGMNELGSRNTDLAISADSDSEFDGIHLAGQLHKANDMSVAVGIVPMLIGGGGEQTNVIDSGFRRYSVDGIKLHLTSNPNGADIHAGGFGLVVFNLNWFRRYWPLPTPERHSISSEYGEDIDMCLAVRRRGGRIIALAVDTVHHDMIGAERSKLYL